MNSPSSSEVSRSSSPELHYDIAIVGAGVAGSALAHSLSHRRPTHLRPLRIALLERSLSEPDRIVGELLQPGGIRALNKLGMSSCVEGIDAVRVFGYQINYGGRSVTIPYPDDEEGRSFHHGRFIMSLRTKARMAKGVDMIEATVTDLAECERTGRVLGVKLRRTGEAEKSALWADLVVVADGCFSNLRNKVIKSTAQRKPETISNFVGVVLEGQNLLPKDRHGTLFLVKNTGPVLMYQIGTNDTRMLVDVQGALPKDLKGHIIDNILPFLPNAMHLPIQAALEKDRPRSMPNSVLAATPQGEKLSKEGVILLGDAWNMRHPLTGGGMTVALADVVLLTDYLAPLENFNEWDTVAQRLSSWFWARKPIASTVNILSVALYQLFGADDQNLEVLREGCFKYFELGGECVRGPVSLLAGIAPSPVLLFNHFFAVAFYSIWVLFTHPRLVRPQGGNGKPVLVYPSLADYPSLVLRAIAAFYAACMVFGPLLWMEMRWW